VGYSVEAKEKPRHAADETTLALVKKIPPEVGLLSDATKFLKTLENVELSDPNQRGSLL